MAPDRVQVRLLASLVPEGDCMVSTYSVGSHGYSQIGWQDDGRRVAAQHVPQPPRSPHLPRLSEGADVMRLLDLFCGAGGAAMGYSRAGFDEIVGVDVAEQPHYPFTFVRADAMTYPLEGFDAVHASPPCQGYTTMTNRRGRGSTSPLLIAAVRDRLVEGGRPYVIENVCGARAHLRDPLLLHGGMFGLGVYRPRLFESNMLIMAPARRSPPKDAAAVYGRREDRRRLWTRNDGSELRAASLDEARAAMGMPWADWTGVREAIPPAYTEHIGHQLLMHLGAAA